ncbi:MAG: IS110 family transposase [Acidimicrobiia bacterium]
MVVIGIDAHKKTHTAVAVDEAGRRLGSVTVPATSEGHLKLVRWAARFEQCRWAVEDCRHVTVRLERDLLAVGQCVSRVPPALTARTRKMVRAAGKSDEIDALAVARAALANPDLPIAVLDGPSRQLRQLVDHREQMVGHRTAMQNRVRWFLHELDPEYQPGSLSSLAGADRVLAWLADGRHDPHTASLCAELVTLIRQATVRINQLKSEITRRVKKIARFLLDLRGVGPLTAAKLIGEIGNITRFKSRDAFAMWAGSAPIPASSGNQNVYRLNRGGNRQVNAALHRIAVTQARDYPPAQAIIARHSGDGRTKKHAYRVLKRRLANVIYTTLVQHQQHTQTRAA